MTKQVRRFLMALDPATSEQLVRLAEERTEGNQSLLVRQLIQAAAAAESPDQWDQRMAVGGFPALRAEVKKLLGRVTALEAQHETTVDVPPWVSDPSGTVTVTPDIWRRGGE